MPAPVMNTIFLHLSIYSDTPFKSKDLSFLELRLKHFPRSMASFMSIWG